MGLKIVYALPGAGLSRGVKVVLDHVTRLNRLPFIRAYAMAPGPPPEWLKTLDVPLISANREAAIIFPIN